MEEATAEIIVQLWDFSDFGKKLKAYRKKLAITQEAMASMIGTNPFTLRSWEQGNAKPPYRIWRQCEHLFNEALLLL